MKGIPVDYVFPGSLDFGGSPTHSKLHVGCLMLDMAARRDFQTHGARGFAELKRIGEQRIHDELLKLLGCRVNEPRAGKHKCIITKIMFGAKLTIVIVVVVIIIIAIISMAGEGVGVMIKRYS